MSNLDAFLTMIAVSEATNDIGDRGYNCLVTSTVSHPILFPSYADHPRIHVHVRDGLVSTAAGRYQILERIFDAYKAQLHLPDFSPGSQDLIALQMIRECGAFADVVAGRFDEAVSKCASRWASLPGNTHYGQHQNALVDLRQAFAGAGGLLA